MDGRCAALALMFPGCAVAFEPGGLLMATRDAGMTRNVSRRARHDDDGTHIDSCGPASLADRGCKRTLLRQRSAKPCITHCRGIR